MTAKDPRTHVMQTFEQLLEQCDPDEIPRDGRSLGNQSRPPPPGTQPATVTSIAQIAPRAHCGHWRTRTWIDHSKGRQSLVSESAASTADLRPTASTTPPSVLQVSHMRDMGQPPLKSNVGPST